VAPVRYELSSYIPEDGILHRHHRENLKSYIAFTGWVLTRRRNVPPVRYELSSYIPEDSILHSHRRENLKSYIVQTLSSVTFRHGILIQITFIAAEVTGTVHELQN
jgi:hypothetical protein